MKWMKLFLILMFLFPAAGCDDDSSPSSTGPGDEPSGDYDTRTAVVTYVYDGDTIQVDNSERVRYIGIDTPERGECYYWEATQRNRELVDDRTVTLEVCKEESEDHYGRTLAHIKVDGKLVNAILIEEGFANALRIPPCISRADYYFDLRDEARDANRGMWGDCP